jgi:cytoplasmic iron level regulating protein YaaA (DUF328/UPF0246 family)
MPAWQRYRGRVFVALDRVFPKLLELSTVDIVIVSARFGCVRPDTLLPNYDARMTPDTLTLLRPGVRRTLKRLVAEQDYAATFVLLESEYLAAIDLSDLPSPEIETELTDPGIEHLMRWLAAALAT